MPMMRVATRRITIGLDLQWAGWKGRTSRPTKPALSLDRVLRASGVSVA
jgi:hypothetical protein